MFEKESLLKKLEMEKILLMSLLLENYLWNYVFQKLPKYKLIFSETCHINQLVKTQNNINARQFKRFKCE